MHHLKEVFMGLGVVVNLLSSCIEVYPKETIGLLGGYHTTRRHKLVMAYPLQKAVRKRDTVTIVDRRSYLRNLRILEPMGIEFYGFYHSHPDGTANPSESDLLTSMDEILTLDDKRMLLEIIVEIRRKKYRRKQKPDFMLREFDTPGGGVLDGYLIEPRNRFDFKFVGEWVELSRLYYGISPNRYQVNLNILEKDVTRRWQVERY